MKTKSIIIGGLVGLLLLSPISGYCSSFFSISIGSDGVNITTNFGTPGYNPVPLPPKPEPKKPEPKKPEPKKHDNKKHDNKKPGNNGKPGGNQPGNNQPGNNQPGGNNPSRPSTGGNGTHNPTGRGK